MRAAARGPGMIAEIKRDVDRARDLSALPVVGVAAETILPFRTAAEASREQPDGPLWFVPGFVAPGVVVEIVGKLKASGKTTFVSWLIWALVQGFDFLGRPTRKTAVV